MSGLYRDKERGSMYIDQDGRVVELVAPVGVSTDGLTPDLCGGCVYICVAICRGEDSPRPLDGSKKHDYVGCGRSIFVEVIPDE